MLAIETHRSTKPRHVLNQDILEVSKSCSRRPVPSNIVKVSGSGNESLFL